MQEECLICKAPLEYLQEDVLMECAICHKKENSKASETQTSPQKIRVIILSK